MEKLCKANGWDSKESGEKLPGPFNPGRVYGMKTVLFAEIKISLSKNLEKIIVHEIINKINGLAG
ncbi:hypothetical protein SAMN04488057_11582 [Cyclobacterium lianum]|uniref:Uncharacterized protein n=1 Tax=Cyclobacterium lianum TaxID=388280 RepID=A0A1M7Q997_9BACT|nr:hypothetical protein SAMN04488057_11582 [Cyclobacterium lianum]